MKKSELLIALFVIALLGAGAFLWLSPGSKQQTPTLQMTSARGETIHIKPRLGYPVLVNFWATTCTTCLKEMPHLVKLYQELKPKGLQVIGVSMYYDPPIQVDAMIKQKKIPYPIVFDLDKRIMRAFGMQTPVTPTTVLIDPQGSIVYRKLGMPDMHKLKQQIEAMLAIKS